MKEKDPKGNVIGSSLFKSFPFSKEKVKMKARFHVQAEDTIASQTSTDTRIVALPGRESSMELDTLFFLQTFPCSWGKN